MSFDPRDLNNLVKRKHFQLPTFEDISTTSAGVTYFTKIDVNKAYWQYHWMITVQI